jgi:hypothetical protein
MADKGLLCQPTAGSGLVSYRGTLPLTLFGAFDRHNFGDLLFPHLMTELLPGRSFEFAGLAQRDLRHFGGHCLHPLVSMGRERPAHLIHAGGEVLTCSAWEAAVMLLDADAAQQAIERYDDDPDAAAAWAASQLGTMRRAPYVAGREFVAPPGQLIFNAVGGVEWAAMPATRREEVKQALRGADWLSVRDHVTQRALQQEGIAAELCPDPAVMVRTCFGETIRQRREGLKPVRQAFPRGYLASQFSADFADDASLEALAQGLSRVAAETRLGVVFFRAGAAPWHDDRGLYEKLRLRMKPGSACVFDSLHLWDICALIAASRGVIASSLHARVVAMAYGLPRVSLKSPQQGDRPNKVGAFAETWEPSSLPRCVALGETEHAVRQALEFPSNLLHAHAAWLCDTYRASLAQWRDGLSRDG